MPDDPTPKPKGKKIPIWLIIAGGGVVVLGVLYYQKKKKSEPVSEQEALQNQSFIPVTGGAGAGAGGSLGGNTGFAESQASLLLNQEEASQKLILGFIEQSEKENRLFNEQVINTIRSQTGGGAPQSPGSPGVITAPPEGGGKQGPVTTTTTGPTTTGTKNQPVSVSPNIIKCGNGCTGHEYPHGHSGRGHREVDCQHRDKNHKCVW